MASPVALKRLNKEYLSIQKSPPPFITALPLESNILEWHYALEGPPDSPYAGGIYHGVLVFPPEYPFKPPAIKMFTPSGRFQTNFRLCLTISDYHPSTWNPAWSVSTILTGLLSFMLEDTPTTGSINTSTLEKRNLATKSHAFNASNPVFVRLFPSLIKLRGPKVSKEIAKEPLKIEPVIQSSNLVYYIIAILLVVVLIFIDF